MSVNPWTEEEVQILKLYFPTEGWDIVKRLPRRNKKDIYAKADRLGLVKKTSHLWTEEEIEILKKYYPIESADELKIRLSRHSSAMINNKALKLGLRKTVRGKGLRNKWSSAEEDLLKQYYQVEGDRILPRLPGRTMSDIRQKAFRMGLTNGRFGWTEEEDSYLREHYADDSTDDIAKVIENHNRSSIVSRAKYLGLKKTHRDGKKKVEQATIEWTFDEDETIKKYYYEESLASLSKRLPGRTHASISTRAHSLGLAKRSKGILWTQEELGILKELYGKVSSIELLKKLPNRTYNSIRTQATLLGLTEKRQKASKTPASKQDESAIIEEERTSPEETSPDGEIVDAQQESDEIPVAEGVNPEKPDILVVDENGDPKQKRKKKRIRKKRASKERKTRKADIWTEEEDEIVRTRFNKDDLSVLMTKLPNHTLASIRRRARKLGVANNQNLVNWTKEEIEILEKYYPIEGTAVLYRLKKHSLNSIRVAAKVLKIKTNRMTEPWAYKEDYLACQHYLSHVNDWFEEKVIDELLNIFISNGYLKHGRTTLRMKLANCSYIHTGIGLEHASNQNIRAYKKLTGVGFVRRVWRRFYNFLRRILHAKSK